MVQGGKWDSNSKKLVRNEDKDIRLKKMPVVHVIPTLEKKPTQGTYHCPLYKTLVRRGVLSTTGHSTNRVSLLQIPTELKVDECARLSIALFLSSDQ